MARIPDESIDCIICDLPYGTTACHWDTILPFDQLWEHYQRITKKQAMIVLFGAEPFSSLLRMSNLKQYKYDWYWEKNTVTGFAFAKYQPMRAIETISVFSKGKVIYYPQGIYEKKPEVRRKRTHKETIYGDKGLSSDYVSTITGYPRNVLKFPKETNTFHPTQKPVGLIEYLIKTYTKKGDIVLDNCMGSGTTAVACLNTERYYIGFEINAEYYQQSLIRIKENTTQLSLF
ncbi:site-specific DNA-methyltransferase [Enterococcus hirae]|nr:site-specific DNA-methyltransferase [Enterococcus hirae]